MRRERGTASVMIVGLAVVAVMLVGVVVDASAAYLRRSGLDSLADGAALAAADGVQGRQVYEGGLGERARIDPEVARAYVDQYLRDTGAARRFPGLRYEVRGRRRPGGGAGLGAAGPADHAAGVGAASRDRGHRGVVRGRQRLTGAGHARRAGPNCAGCTVSKFRRSRR